LLSRLSIAFRAASGPRFFIAVSAPLFSDRNVEKKDARAMQSPDHAADLGQLAEKRFEPHCDVRPFAA